MLDEESLQFPCTLTFSLMSHDDAQLLFLGGFHDCCELSVVFLQLCTQKAKGQVLNCYQLIDLKLPKSVSIPQYLIKAVHLCELSLERMLFLLYSN